MSQKVIASFNWLLILLTLLEKEISYNKKHFSCGQKRFWRKQIILIHNFVTIDIFLLKESNYCYKKSILVTRNQFLWQEINSNQKNSLSLVKLALIPCGFAGILQKNLPELMNFVRTWFPGSPWICHPVENWDCETHPSTPLRTSILQL